MATALFKEPLDAIRTLDHRQLAIHLATRLLAIDPFRYYEGQPSLVKAVADACSVDLEGIEREIFKSLENADREPALSTRFARRRRLGP